MPGICNFQEALEKSNGSVKTGASGLRRPDRFKPVPDLETDAPRGYSFFEEEHLKKPEKNFEGCNNFKFSLVI